MTGNRLDAYFSGTEFNPQVSCFVSPNTHLAFSKPAPSHRQDLGRVGFTDPSADPVIKPLECSEPFVTLLGRLRLLDLKMFRLRGQEFLERWHDISPWTMTSSRPRKEISPRD